MTNVQLQPLLPPESHDVSVQQIPLSRVLYLPSAVGLVLFLTYFFAAFEPNKHYLFSSPLTLMWAGLSTLWFAFPLAIWWQFFSTSASRLSHQIIRVFSILFSLFGAIGGGGFASLKGESNAAVGFLLLFSSAGSFACFLSTRALRTHPFRITDDIAPNKHRSRFPCLFQSAGFVIFFLGLVFSGAVSITACLSAAEQSAYPAPGSIYTISAGPQRPDLNLQMHLYCQGNELAPVTVLLEHGGGSNSATLEGIQQELVNVHGLRACLHDRLGYGYSPSMFCSDTLASIPDTGFHFPVGGLRCILTACS